MKQFAGYKAEEMEMITALPAGGYVAKILGVKIQDYSWGSVLVLMFDVCEGEYRDFFTKKYRNNDREDKKWSGNYRLTIPKEGDQYYDTNKKMFGNAMWAVEASNSGYHWDWNEQGLVGKQIGVIFRNREWDYNGSTGWTTECGAVTSTENIKTGNFKVPKDRPLKRDSSDSSAPSFNASPASNFEDIPADEDLPF